MREVEEQPAVRPVPSLRERRRERTRQELVDAALDVIAEGGIEAATVDRLAARSGMARGTLYAHFPEGREEVLRAAYDRLTHTLVERTRSAVTRASTWTERLRALAAALIELAGDRRVGHFYNVSGPVVLAGAPERGRGSGASVELAGEVLRQAAAASELGPDVEPHATAVLLIGALREAGIAVADARLTPSDALAAFERIVEGLRAR